MGWIADIEGMVELWFSLFGGSGLRRVVVWNTFKLLKIRWSRISCKRAICNVVEVRSDGVYKQQVYIE